MSLLTTLRSLHALRRAPLVLLAGFAATTLWACGRVAEPTASSPPTSGALAEAESGPRFLTPPQPLSAIRRPDGDIEITGRAAPGAVVALRNPDGQSVEAATRPEGDWRLRLPASPTPRLYALAATVNGRVLRGEGALLQTPAPAPAAFLLRAGAATLAFGEPNGALALDVFDFDGAGGLAIAGRASPKAALRLTLDDRPAVAGQADAKGRFALMAVQGDLKPGQHALHVEAAGRAVDAVIDATPAHPPAGTPYAVRPVSGGWRVDWATPGGGSQSSVVFAIGASGAAG